MERRSALVVLASPMAGSLGRAQTITNSATLRVANPPAPMPLIIELDGWSEIRVTAAGRTIVVTPAEIMAALTPTKEEA